MCPALMNEKSPFALSVRCCLLPSRRKEGWHLTPSHPAFNFFFAHRVSGAAFPSPTASEMAEISRIQYEMEYTEGISQRMRVPEKLKVAPPNADLEQEFQEGVPNASVIMQVPERIVVAGIVHLVMKLPGVSLFYIF